MDFGRRVVSGPSRVGLLPTSGANELSRRPCSLTLYNEPPSDAISLDDFEGLAVERLKVLSVAENHLSRGESLEKTIRKVEEAMRNTHLEVKNQEEKDQDRISHWVLRLAFAATEDLRKRFLSFEVLLFKIRFSNRLDMSQVQTFMRENQLGYHPISKAEFKSLYEPLRDVFLSTRHFQSQQHLQEKKGFDSVQFYKVGFSEVLELVSRRQVLVRQGFAYVPETELVTILSSRFRSNLSQKLAVAYRALPYIRQEDRIRPLLKMLETAYVGPEYGNNQNAAASIGCEIRADNLDQMAQSFPMCMREVHAAMKRDHHLKYHARLQFQLFLKGIGLSMQECLKFFQMEFAKRPTSADVFQKKYAYSIRHAYGQEGKRADYRPYSCMKIIMGVQPSNSNEHHGCPFKTYGPANMRRLLTRQMGNNHKAEIDEIIEQVEQKQFQLACRKHFEFTHQGGNSEAVGNHPNAWFEESLKYFDQNNNNNLSQSSQSTMPQQQQQQQQQQQPEPMDVQAS